MFTPGIGLLASAVLVLFGHTASATSYPVAFSSFSPQLDFKPDSMNNTGGSSWNGSWTGITWAERQPNVRGGRMARGNGYHWVYGSATSGASVSVTFYGTGAEFFGYWGYLGNGTVTDTANGPGAGAVTLSLTGGPDAQQDVSGSGTTPVGVGGPVSLGKYTDLTRGTYTVTMRPTAGIVSFTHVVVEMDLGGSLTQVRQANANPSLYEPFVVNHDNSLGIDPTFGTFHGSSSTDQYGGTGSWAGQSSDDSKRIGSRTWGESVNINLGTGNNFLNINGSTNANHGLYRVKIDPAPPGLKPSTDFWGTASWQVLEEMVYTVGLDPDVEYSVTLTNLQGADGLESEYYQWFDITSVTLWKVPTSVKPKSKNIIGQDPTKNNDSGKGSTPIGAVVGGVIGGVVLIAAVGFLIWWMRRRKRRPDNLFDAVDTEPEPFYVDGTAAAGTNTMTQTHAPAMLHPSPVDRSRHLSASSMVSGSQGYDPSNTYTTDPAIDAGPVIGGFQPPPTYNHLWDGSSSGQRSAHSSAVDPLDGGSQHGGGVPPGGAPPGGAPAAVATMGRVVRGHDTKG